MLHTMGRWLAAVVVAGCGRIAFDPVSTTTGSDADVPTDAVTLALTPIPVTSGAKAICAAIVSNGLDLALAWMDQRDMTMTGRLYFARVAVDGSVLVAERMFGAPGEYVGCPSLIWTGSSYGVAWHMDLSEDVYAIVLDTQGVGTQTTIANSGPNETSPTIAWNGSRFGVAYGYHNGANSSVRFRPMSATGAPLQNALDVAGADVGQGAIAALPNGFAVIHVLGQFQTAGIEYVEIDNVGTLVGTKQMVLPPQQTGGFVFAHDGTRYAIVFQDNADHASVVTGSRADGPGAARTVSTARTQEIDIVAAGTGFAVAWVELTGTNTIGKLLFTRIHPDGTSASPIYQLATNVTRAAITPLGAMRFAVVYIDAMNQLVMAVFDA
jgi:hypothetical protein